MVASIPKPRATYADVLSAPEHKVAELVDGELYLSPRPALLHSLAGSALGEELGPPFKRGRGGPGGWMILDEPELHFGANVVVPDLAGWRTERLPVVENVPYLELAPDWLCEVLSPSTRRFDRTKKLPIYARAGVRHVWLVDPIDRVLEVMRLDAERWSLLGTFTDDARVRAEPFEVFELELGVLWQGAPPPTSG